MYKHTSLSVTEFNYHKVHEIIQINDVTKFSGLIQLTIFTM